MTAPRDWKDLINQALSLLFPIECLCCEKEDAYICDECLRTCLTATQLNCPVCEQKSVVGATHGKCASPRSIDGIFAAGNFQNGLLQTAIKKFKYHNVQKLADPLGRFLAINLEKNFSNLLRTENFAVTFVPLYPARERLRGYNQSRLIAKDLAQRLNLNLADVVEKIENTPNQASLKRAERLKNLEKVFQLKPGQNIQGKNFLLVDDVTTTGATMREIAALLKRKGAGKVWGAAVAYEPKTAF